MRPTAGGNPNPLFQSDIDPSLGGPDVTSRDPGDPADLPTRQDVRNVLAIPTRNP